MNDQAIINEAIRRFARSWCPWEPSPKQKVFLDLECTEALYGGAAGGGKSVCLLMDALRYMGVPGFSALIIRRTLKELKLPGAVMDLSHQWLDKYRDQGVHWAAQDYRWTFPSGAVLQFGYLENDGDKYRYQGSQYAWIGFDEATQFPESHYLYLRSRLRAPTSLRVSEKVRCTSNPGGVGHDWVYDRFIANPKDRVFVPAKLIDNPHINQASYSNSLMQLDEVTRRQLLDGEWVKDTQGLVYSFRASRNIAPRPEGEWSNVLAVDLGASEAEPTTAFVVTGYRKHHRDTHATYSKKHAAMSVHDTATEIKRLMSEFNIERVVVDYGALGVGYIREFQKHYNIPCTNARKQDKLGYRKLLNGDLERGDALIGPQCDELIGELESLIWNDKGTDAHPSQPDHASDAYLYAWRECLHWAQLEKPPEPEMGTEEYLEKMADDMKKRMMQRVAKKDKPWFAGM